MSSDKFENSGLIYFLGLNPFGTGQCLPTKMTDKLIKSVSLNPFGTGQCLPTVIVGFGQNHLLRLNPFGTGQCLPTAVVF